MSDMKKIKTNFVTFVTDNVLLVGIIGNKNLLACMLQDKEREGRIERAKEKGGDATTVREQRGLATGPPQSVRRSQTQNAGRGLWRRRPRWPRGVFLRAAQPGGCFASIQVALLASASANLDLYINERLPLLT